MSEDSKEIKANQLVSFIQNERSLIGELVKETKDVLSVKNPVAVHLNAVEGGQIQVQLFPLWFSELLSGNQRKTGVQWDFKTSQIVQSDKPIELADNLVNQYNRTFGYVQSPQIIPPETSKVVNLFDV